MKAKILIIITLAALAVAGFILHNSPRRAGPAPAVKAADLPPLKGAPTLRLPAPRMPAVAAESEPGQDSQLTNLLVRLLKGEEVKLNPEQVEAYLRANGRRAETLVAAFRATQDPKLLREALEKYPNDPRVNYAAYFAPVCNGNLQGEFPPEERRRLLEAFKQSAPDNALANYLSAQNYFESGDTDRAVGELQAALGKTKFKDYSADFVQNAEEAYRQAGYSEAEAKVLATLSLPLPALAQLRGLSRSLGELAALYRQSGDAESARATLQIGLNLGERLPEEPGMFQSSIQDIVSIKMQENILAGMDPDSPYGSAGQTVKDRLAELSQRRGAILEQGKQENAILPTLSEPELIGWVDRMKVFGEAEAWRWLMSKRGGGMD